MKIIFLDVDGPLIPARMYYNGSQKTGQGVWLYDPLAREMIRTLCTKYNAFIVYNSSHNDDGLEHMRAQAKVNALDHHLHATDWITKFPRETYDRAHGVTEWLSRYPEVTHWVDVDDFQVQVPNFVQVDFNQGISLSNYEAMEKFLK